MGRRWADVAELIATQGLKGRLVARPVRGLPFLLCEGLAVHFVPPTLEGPRTAVVRRVQHLGSGEYAVEFSGVKNRDVAERLTGSHCLACRCDLPDDFEDLLHGAADYLEGLAVEDERLGFVGEVRAVQAMPTQELLTVDGGPFGEVFIPLVDDFIVAFDDEARTLRMDLPRGLVDADDAVCDSTEDDA